MGVETKSEYPFAVDTWTQVSRRKPFHFLTHAHKDHTVGIECHGTFPIYCTSLTEKLVCRRYPKLNRSIFKNLEIGESKILGDADHGFTVTAYDANHCPGAIMLLFEGSFGNVLHTGDCRLTPDCLTQLMDYSSSIGKVLDCVYLDCTFGAEPMVLPSKEQAIEQVKTCIWNHPSDSKVYLACDMLGQETLLEAIANDFGVKIFVDRDRLSNYYADLEVIAAEFFTTDKDSTRFEICEGYPKFYERAQQTITQARNEGRIQPLFIRPSTQWYVFEERLQGDGSGVISTLPSSKFESSKLRSTICSIAKATKDEHGVFHVCYSMHSSQAELKAALRMLNPSEVISTTPLSKACAFAKPAPQLTNSRTMSIDATVEVVEVPVPVLKGRELKEARNNYSCSPSKAINNKALDSPEKDIPLFGSAQYSLPTSPCPPPFWSPPLPMAISSSETLSIPSRAKRLFLEPEPDRIETSTKSDSQSLSKEAFCISEPFPSQLIEPNLSPPVAPSLFQKSQSLPVPEAPQEEIQSHNVRSRRFSRFPTRRRFRVPEPLPSLSDFK